MGLGQFSYIPFPEPGTTGKPIDAAMVEKFFDQRCDYRSSYRIELNRERTLAKAYVESVQWVRLDVGYDPRRAVRWTEVDPQRKIPKPITNEIYPIFDSAVSRIAQRQSKPSIRSRSGTANSKTGSKLAQDVAEWHFDQEIEWSKIRRDGIYKECLYGEVIWKSFWDLDYRELTRVGVDAALECAAPCSFCGGTGKGPLMGADGLALPPSSELGSSTASSLPSFVPGAAPDAGHAASAKHSDVPRVASLDPNKPPFPSRNPNLARVGDQSDSASEYSVAGQAPPGGTPQNTGQPNPEEPPVYPEDTTGPRPRSPRPPNGPPKYSLSHPDPTDPSYDFSVTNLDPQDFACPMCNGTGMQSCGVTLASKDIEPADLLKVPGNWMANGSVDRKEQMSVDGGGYAYSFNSCPGCGAPLKSYDPTPEEVEDGQDAIGRDLGQDVPLGRARVECVSSFDFFVENEGIDRGPGQEECDEFYQNTPRSLDWLANHYENTKDIKAEDPNLIAQHHPILGEYSFWSVGSRIAAERNVYQNHVRVREAYKKRSVRYPLGRHLVMAGKKVLVDDDLYFQSEDDPNLFIPKVNYAVARYFRKDGEYWGQGIVTPLVSLQNRINMTYSQIVDTRERHGTQGIIATRGMRLLSGWIRGFTGRVMLWDTDAQNPDKEPKLFDTKILNEAFPEVQNAVDRMRAISGEQDVDVGKAPTNVSAASGIQLLQEKSAVRNLEREAELMDAQVDTYTHQMQLMRHLAREPREFLKKSGSTWEVSSYLGIDLAGQTDVVIEDQASYDKRLFTREGIIQGIDLGLYDVSDPISKREALKGMGLPLNINEEQNVQIEEAERKFFNFRDTGYVPAVDEFEDDHLLHWSVYGKYLKGSDGVKLRSGLGWDNIVHATAGWKDKLDQALLINTQLKALQNAPPTMGPLGPIPSKPPQMPPGYPMPNALEDQIVWVWTQMLQTAKIQLPPELLLPAIMPGQRNTGLLAFMAVVHAHRIYFEKKQAQAQGGQPTAAAPMGGATPSGNIPTPGKGVTSSGVPAAPPVPARTPPMGPPPPGLPA